MRVIGIKGCDIFDENLNEFDPRFPGEEAVLLVVEDAFNSKHAHLLIKFWITKFEKARTVYTKYIIFFPRSFKT